MGWITTEDGQHIFIGSRGEFMPRGPGSAPAGKKTAAGAANRAQDKGPGGMAARPTSAAMHEKMAASANAASVRAEAARVRGDRRGELQAHEHRALIIAKQNDFRNVHKSGQGQVAPGTEKTAAAALAARVRMGGGTAPPAAPAKGGVNAAFKASATREEVTAAAKGRAGDRAGMARMRIAGGKARVGDYVQAPHGDLNIRRPALVEGRVVAKSADGRMLTIKRGDGKTFQVNAGVAHPVGKGQERFTPARATKAAELRAGRAPAAPAKPAGPSLREQAAAARAGKGTREQRLETLGKGMQKKYNQATKKETALGKDMDSAVRMRNASLAKADTAEKPYERTQHRRDAEVWAQRAREIAAKASKFTAIRNRLTSRSPAIGAAIRASRQAKG